MPNIDEVLYQILDQLSKDGPSTLDNAQAEQLFNLRLINYVVGSRWEINSKGLEQLATGNK